LIVFFNLQEALSQDSSFEQHQASPLQLLRQGVNFINVFRTNFSYEHHFSSFFSSYMYVEKRRMYENFVRLTLMKLTTGVQETVRPVPTSSGSHSRETFQVQTLFPCFFSQIGYT